jgi:hypothetical protein
VQRRREVKESREVAPRDRATSYRQRNIYMYHYREISNREGEKLATEKK